MIKACVSHDLCSHRMRIRVRVAAAVILDVESCLCEIGLLGVQVFRVLGSGFRKRAITTWFRVLESTKILSTVMGGGGEGRYLPKS